MEKTIYYHDTDAIGIVYYSSYLKLLEEGRTNFLKSKGVSVKNLHEQGNFFVIKELKVKYISPARFGDIVVCESTISKITEARIFFSQKIYDKQNNRILVDAENILVIVNKRLQPIIVPESVRSLLFGIQNL
ncbi:MAG: YbgC/FadM family acyl-CoA thioesterase [Candidatus Omnitrophica bacterium]|nr:YbgC/FadM family acyl-CoA thioesterase [Candidatus Omnitrophota bacterium]